MASHFLNAWLWGCGRRWEWQPTPVFLPGEFHGKRSYSQWGCKDSDTTEGLSRSWGCMHHFLMYPYRNSYHWRWLCDISEHMMSSEHISVSCDLKKKKLKTGDFVLKPHLYKWQFIPTRNILFAHIEQQRMSMGLGRTSLLTPKQHCISALPNQCTDQCQKLLGWNWSQSGETVAKILEETWSVRDFHSCWA